MASSLEIAGINKRFGNGDKSVEVLRKIDIHVAPGEFLILFPEDAHAPLIGNEAEIPPVKVLSCPTSIPSGLAGMPGNEKNIFCFLMAR